MISKGSMSASRSGTRPTSMSIPTPPAEAISPAEEVSPAAPEVLQRDQQPALEQLQAALEQLRLLEGVADLDRRPLRVVALSSSAEASTEAPPIPSRPVEAPIRTISVAGPGRRRADHLARLRASPTHIALTRQLCS